MLEHLIEHTDVTLLNYICELDLKNQYVKFPHGVVIYYLIN